jgi:hypothetical protein
MAYREKNLFRAFSDLKTGIIAKNKGITNHKFDIQALKDTNGISLVRMQNAIQKICSSKAIETGCFITFQGSLPLWRKRRSKKKLIPAKMGSVGRDNPKLKFESFRVTDKGVNATINSKRLFK